MVAVVRTFMSSDFIDNLYTDCVRWHQHQAKYYVDQTFWEEPKFC